MPALLLALVLRHCPPTLMRQCRRLPEWRKMEEAKSESYWTAQAKGKERDWWSIDLEGEVEELEEGCPWTVTKGDSMDPEGEMNHKSDGKRAAIEEEENWGILKEDKMEVEMEVDAGVPQAESSEIKSPKRKVIRVESEETRQSVRKKQRSLLCRVLLASQEEPFTSATITAVKPRSDTDSLRVWSLKEKLEQ